MKSRLQFLLFLIFISLELSTVSAVTYLSSASNGAAWTSTTTLDAYQNTANNFVGQSSSITYNPDDGDTLQGFFMFKNGFSSWTNGHLYWDARGVIDGQFVIPGGGALHLSSPLHLGPTATLSVGGSFWIYAAGKSLFLEGSQISLDKTLFPQDAVVIDGLSHTLTVTNGGTFSTSGGSSALTLRNMDIKCTNTTTNILNWGLPLTLENLILRSAGSTGMISLYDDYESFGDIVIKGNVRFEGFGQRIKVRGGLTINTNSTLYVGQGVTLTNISSIGMTDQTSILHLDGCQFYTGDDADGDPLSSALSLNKGTLILENKVKIFNRNYGYTGTANTDMSKAFILGSGTPEDAVNVVVRADAYVTVDGCINYMPS